jgi:hypothetical protein
MALPTVTDSLDAIPEPLRAAYIEREGKFHLDADIEDVTPLKSTLDKERQRADVAEKERKRLDREFKELQQKQDAAKLGKTDEELKQLRESVRGDLESEYAPFKEKAEKYDSLHRSVLLDTPIKELMLSESVGVRGERQVALWKLVGDRFDLTDDGKPMVKDHPGLSVEKYLADQVKKEFPEFYKGTQAAGGGAGGTTAKPADAPTKPPTQWSSEERRIYIEANGPAAYRALLDAQVRDGVKAKAS